MFMFFFCLVKMVRTVYVSMDKGQNNVVKFVYEVVQYYASGYLNIENQHIRIRTLNFIMLVCFAVYSFFRWLYE